MLLHFANTLVQLPVELQAVLAVAVMYAVRRLLAGRVPDEFVTRIAAAVTGLLLTVSGLLLGLIPLEFGAVAVAILNLLVVLLGGIVAVNALTSRDPKGFLA